MVSLKNNGRPLVRFRPPPASGPIPKERNLMTAESPTSAGTQHVPCHWLHIEYAQRFAACPDCRRPLWSAPKSKCRNHSTYCCPDCFTSAQIDEFAQQRMMTGRTP